MSRTVHSITIVALLIGFGLIVMNTPSAAVTWQTIRWHLVDWQAFTSENRLLACVLFVLVYSLVTGLSLPMATAFSLLAGALFGRWLGTLLAVTAATIGGTLAFLTSRYLFRERVRRDFGTRLAVIENGFARDGGYYLLTLRLMPILPFFAINLAMGLTPIRTRLYVIVSWIGMIPGAFVIVNAGRAAANVKSVQGLVSVEMLITLSLLAGLPFAVRAAVGRRLRRQ